MRSVPALVFVEDGIIRKIKIVSPKSIIDKRGVKKADRDDQIELIKEMTPVIRENDLQDHLSLRLFTPGGKGKVYGRDDIIETMENFREFKEMFDSKMSEYWEEL